MSVGSRSRHEKPETLPRRVDFQREGLERLASVLREQLSLSQLSELGERLQRDAAELIDFAASEGRQIPSASVEAEVRFPDEAARAEFMAEYVDTLKSLLAKYGRSDGARFRVALAAYPVLEEEW